MLAALHALGAIDDGLYGRLDGPRDARNAWMHALGPVSTADASVSLGVAQDVVRAQLGLDVDLAPELLLRPAV